MKDAGDFHGSDAGPIPRGWEASTVGAEFDVRLGKMLDAARNVGEPKPYLGNRSVQWGRVDVDDLGMVPLTRAEQLALRLRSGDLLVCEGGEVGRAAIWRDQLPECYYQKALHRLRPRNGYSPELMAAYLRFWSEQGALADYVTQTSIAHLPREKLVTVPLPRPPSEEQAAIARALSDADALLTKLDEFIAKKRDIKQAAMQQLLPGHHRLPGQAEPWLRVRLGDLFDFRNGVNADKRAYGRGIQFINVLEVITRPHLTADHVPGRVLLARGLQETFAVRRGDVLFNRTSETQGEVALASAYIDDAPMVFGGFVIRGRPKAQRLDALYAGYGLRAPEVRQQLVARGQGAIRSNVGQAELSAVEIRLPCVREQQAIAAVLSDMDTELAALEARRDKTRQLKQGMMQALLTGRIRLV
ncbi:MAG: restriction endonuclease subunit S [Burkholderiales bacterium]|nr:restriction endonuclease subunit S [Burkholderiales bacterium]